MSDALQIQTALQDSSQRAAIQKMLSEMLITIEDKVFTDRSFYVDGYRFINCSFERCNLYILRGTVEFHHCVSKGGTRFWGEDAMRCIQLYTLDYPNLALSDVFSAKRYPDKSFTIAKDVSI